MGSFRIRELRQQQGLTLDALARQAGISGPLLSQVERDVVDPSLATLRSVAKALGVPLFDLFAPESETARVSVVRAGHETTIMSPNGGVKYVRKSSPGRDVEVLHGHLEPGATSHDEPWSHEAEEVVWVLSGAITVEVAGSQVDLGPGDSAHFDSRQPHLYRNASQADAEFVVATTPPSY